VVVVVLADAPPTKNALFITPSGAFISL